MEQFGVLGWAEEYKSGCSKLAMIAASVLDSSFAHMLINACIKVQHSWTEHKKINEGFFAFPLQAELWIKHIQLSSRILLFYTA